MKGRKTVFTSNMKKTRQQVIRQVKLVESIRTQQSGSLVVCSVQHRLAVLSHATFLQTCQKSYTRKTAADATLHAVPALIQSTSHNDIKLPMHPGQEVNVLKILTYQNKIQNKTLKNKAHDTLTRISVCISSKRSD